MSGTIVQLQDSTIASVTMAGQGEVRVRFSPAMIVKSQGIPRVDASTLWTQHGELVMDEAEIEGDMPELPAPAKDGSMEAGGLKYMGMIPVPLDAMGYVQLRLSFGDESPEVVVTGTRARLEMRDIPKYVQHIAETQPAG